MLIDHGQPTKTSAASDRLEVQQIGTLSSCQGEACAGALVAFGAVSAATAIVSGSIVIIGNVAYWLESKGQCIGSPIEPV